MNLFDFTDLMYRPRTVGPGYSATPNIFASWSARRLQRRNVTIKLKQLQVVNGSPVTAQDVMFWINMDRAVPRTGPTTPRWLPRKRLENQGGELDQVTMTSNKNYSS